MGSVIIFLCTLFVTSFFISLFCSNVKLILSISFCSALLLTLFFSYFRKEAFNKSGKELIKYFGDDLVYYDEANYLYSKGFVSGYLVLLHDSIRFVPNCLNEKFLWCSIPLINIKGKGKGKYINSIYIDSICGDRFIFVVNNKKKWLKLLDDEG